MYYKVSFIIYYGGFFIMIKKHSLVGLLLFMSVFLGTKTAVSYGELASSCGVEYQEYAAERLIHYYTEFFKMLGQELAQSVKKYTGNFNDKTYLKAYVSQVMNEFYPAVREADSENIMWLSLLPKTINMKLKQEYEKYSNEVLMRVPIDSTQSLDEVAENLNRYILGFGTILSGVLKKKYPGLNIAA
jgi:hypothetical protein